MSCLVRAPEDAGLHHALGLLLIRMQQREEALRHFELASTLAPEQPRYSYVYGIALNSMGYPARALAVLESAHERQPANTELWLLLNELRAAPENR